MKNIIFPIKGPSVILGPIIGLAAFFLCEPALSQTLSAEQSYVDAISRSNNIRPLSTDAFGEKINLKDGDVRFEWTDIDIPGNSNIPIRLQRVLKIEGTTMGGELGGFDLGGSFDVPYLGGVFPVTGWQVNGTLPNNRCSNPAPPPSATNHISASDYWTGNSLHIPGESDELMLAQPSNTIPEISDDQSYPWITKSFWRISCLPQTKNGYPGEGFLAISPNGDKYYFDWVVTKHRYSYSKMYANYGTMDSASLDAVRFLVSRIEDRFGNWANYTYSNNLISTITSNDGRFIKVTGISDGKITSVSSSIGNYFYNYSNQNQTTITYPDGSSWRIASAGSREITPSEFLPAYTSTPRCPLPDLSVGNYQIFIHTPSGAEATYNFKVARHFRHNIPKICMAFTLQNKTFQTFQYLKFPNFSDSFTLTSKSVTIPGSSPAEFTYEYGIGASPLAFEEQCANTTTHGCPESMKTKIHESTGKVETYTFGAKFGVNENQLLEHSEGMENGTPPNTTETIQRKTVYTYVKDSEIPNHPFPSLVGDEMISFSDHVAAAGLRPLKTIEIVVDNKSHVKSVVSYDIFARPTQIEKSSSP